MGAISEFPLAVAAISATPARVLTTGAAAALNAAIFSCKFAESAAICAGVIFFTPALNASILACNDEA